ncbi:MLP-like protein 28 [Vigna unguiculata]|uniref:MLP-like protein 28 n=1 Tax=Vigna unguiculata TaxID=3917 RepID=UPI001016A502|nr:MLP-like protein 28 [Vigna unguiculata]
MSLGGKISIEIGVHANATKWYNIFATQLNQIQNLTDRIHHAKLHHGHDWHHNESIKQWTYIIDGKVNTCQESAEYDEANKKVIFKLFGGDVAKEYKFINLIFEVSDKENGGANIKWTVDYERLSDQVHPPYGYIEYLYKCTVDFDSHLLKP